MPQTLVDLLRLRAHEQPDRLAYTFLPDESDRATLSYSELDQRARHIGAWLQSLGASNERVLLLYPPGLEYIAAFFGCLYAGCVAVPVYAPRPNRSLARIQNIAANADAKLALTTASILSKIEPLLGETSDLRGLRWLAADTFTPVEESAWLKPSIDSETLALLQYTSGSTGEPKGVMLSHKNLLSNSALLAHAFKYTSESRCVSWLPLYHDMGLIGGMLQPLYGGFPCTLISPVSFLQQPLRWLRAISNDKATISGGPNFAYELCLRTINAEQRASLDLSSWTVAFNGAEPIHSETLHRFVEYFAPCGFRPESFHPCYGLAEATLIVSGGPKNNTLPVVRTVSRTALAQDHKLTSASSESDSQTIVGCGRVLPEQQVIVVDPKFLTQCPDNCVGELWISGPSVAAGYWNRPLDTEQIFNAHLANSNAGAFLRTGDLGFINDDELFLTGRLKDLIIIRGVNHYPQDVERTVERSHSSLRPGCGAAFSVELNNEERLIVVQEIDRRGDTDFDQVIAAIRQAVAEEHELHVAAIVLLKRGSISKTSSGKIQRQACRDAFLRGDLKVAAEWRETSRQNEPDTAFAGSPTSVEDVQAWLVSRLAAKLRISRSGINVSRSITQHGVDSLAAMELLHAIDTELHLSLPMSCLLDSDSVAELAKEIWRQLQELTTAAAEPSETDETSPPHSPLSYGQRALWFLKELEPNNTAYNLAFAVKVRGVLNREALQQAFQRVIERHDVLRTTFPRIDDQPEQEIHDSVEFCIQDSDVSEWSDQTLQDQLAVEGQRPFDLEHGPLLRVKLFRQSAAENVLLFAIHHIVADFWSLALLFSELESFYVAACNGQPLALPRPKQFADYARYQQQQLAGSDGERLWQYWKKQLEGELPVLNLPRSIGGIDTAPQGASQFFTVGPEPAQRLRDFASARGVTLYSVLLAALNVLLSRYAHQDEILIGSPITGRNTTEWFNSVGYFVNAVALRSRPRANLSFDSFLEQVQQTVKAALAHQEYPFSLLVERLQPARQAGISPIFQVSFVLQKNHLSDRPELAALALNEPGVRLKLGELELESIKLDAEQPFELTLMIADAGKELKGSWLYRSQIFEEEIISRLSSHFQQLLETIVSEPQTQLRALQLLTADERAQLPYEWNNTARPVSSESIIELFTEQVARSPQAVAVLDEHQQLTYAELAARALTLAHRLRQQGVGADVLVGIYMERSVDLVVALLGVLYAGGAYLPLDLQSAPQRARQVLGASGSTLVVTHSSHGAVVSEFGARVLLLDEPQKTSATLDEISPLSLPHINGGQLAYVIYTSGSTGAPKGVMISHRALVNHMSWIIREFNIDEHDTVVQKTPVGFDAAAWEFWAPLLVGGQLLMARPGGHQDSRYLCQLINEQRATILQVVPTLLRMLVEDEAFKKCQTLRDLYCGGERLPAELVEQVQHTLPAVRVHNLYGPTEACIDASHWYCARPDETTNAAAGKDRSRNILIGRPIDNTQVYVLDDQLQPEPIGVIGELFIGGMGLARGYLDDPGLTASKFIPDSFSGRHGGRLYRTGDLARFTGDGQLEYVGRIDQQVKLRGYRIELGEIEAALTQHPEVRRVVVQVREDDGRQRLVAWLVPRVKAPTASELRRHCKGLLPEYMIPTVFLMMESLPLTATGKIDRQALPAPGAEYSLSESEMVTPRTEVEAGLAQIWSELLGIKQVGIHNSFFELGGHSLLATQLIARLRKSFQVEVTLRDFFETPTIAWLAEVIEQSPRSQPTRQLQTIRVRPRGGKTIESLLARIDDLSDAETRSLLSHKEQT